MVHTLNSTAIATSRVLVAIMENFQEDGVIRIPEVLWKYTGFKEILLPPPGKTDPDAVIESPESDAVVESPDFDAVSE